MAKIFDPQNWMALKNILIDLQKILGVKKKVLFEDWVEFWNGAISNKGFKKDDPSIDCQRGHLASSLCRVLIYDEEKVRIFALKCFSPKICFDKIVEEKPHSIVLASGTLAPMELFEADLDVKFEI